MTDTAPAGTAAARPADASADAALARTTSTEAAVVLIGAPASGKTTLRHELLAQGRAPGRVLSLDDERATLRDRDLAAGREARGLQDYSLPALRVCQAIADTLLAQGKGYLADATHLRRRERIVHVRGAHAAGLRAVAVLLPALPVEVLSARNSGRDEDRRVPEDVLNRHAHRRSLLTAELLREEGFDEVVEVEEERALAS